MTDDSIPLRVNGRAVGNTLVGGRGPTEPWVPGTVSDQIFTTRMLPPLIDPETMPTAWQKALGYTPVPVPVVPVPVVPVPVVPVPVVPVPVPSDWDSPWENLDTRTWGDPNKVVTSSDTFATRMVMFIAGLFVGLVIRYYLT
jgi:hypothetical protein